jgi:PD-(D/E)XK nuclease superfamily
LRAFAGGKTLTNSARSVFLNCRKKYQYSYVFGLAPRKPSVPFLVGGLFHEELDRMYSEGAFDAEGMKKRVAKACEAASRLEGLTPEDSERIFVQQAVVHGAVGAYAGKYLRDDLKAWEVVEAEGSFRVGLPNGWSYHGKTDLVGRDRRTRRLRLVEHKTAGRLDAAYVAKLPLDNQILGYAWAKREQGLDLDGVTYNVTKKPQIRQRQNETLNDFYRRIEQDYADRPGEYFYRETLRFSNKDVDRFAEELKRFTREIDRCAKEKFFYQNTSQCTALGVCPFMKLCCDGVNKENLMLYRIKERAHEEIPEEDS